MLDNDAPGSLWLVFGLVWGGSYWLNPAGFCGALLIGTAAAAAGELWLVPYLRRGPLP